MIAKVERERVVKEPHTIVRCDQCGTQADVVDGWLPPDGWIQLRRVTANVLQQNPAPGHGVPGHHDFCSWSCCRTFVKLQVDPGA